MAKCCQEKLTLLKIRALQDVIHREDFVSDLIGFCAGYPKKQLLQLCEPVSKDIALKTWDTYGAVGDNKNHSVIPYLYPLPGTKFAGPVSAPLPKELNTIIPQNRE